MSDEFTELQQRRIDTQSEIIRELEAQRELLIQLIVEETEIKREELEP